MYASPTYNRALSTAEQRDFELIVRSAKDSGWLEDDCTLTVEPIEHHVTIVSTIGKYSNRRDYEWTSRWLYQFLADLAHGKWKSKTLQ